MKPIVVLDLEWNGAYSKRIKGFLNEIIEFGAVKLDAQMQPEDTFAALVRPQVGKKISDKIAALTSITDEELASGTQFMRAVSRFRQWAGDCLLMTWGTSDILTLIENCRYFSGNGHIPFLTDYVDAQAYCEDRMAYEKGKQMGLSTAAELLQIDADALGHHRALDDSLLTARCLKAVYNGPAGLQPFIQDATQEEFYKRMEFRTVILSDMEHPLVRNVDLSFTCPACGAPADRCEDWQLHNKNFYALFCCPSCQTKFCGRVQFKLKYEGLQVKKTTRPYVAPEEEPEHADPTGASAPLL
jgi:DNA polymerase III epsilon subunit-like protein